MRSVNITSNLNWSVSESFNWIAVSPSSVANNGTVSISVAANSTRSSRTKIVSVAAGILLRDITITQGAGKDIFGELDSNLPPSENFDLSTRNLSIPIDEEDGTATNFSVSQLNNNYIISTYFFTASDGGMVFKCPVDGATTSTNTVYARVELREMLRGTNTTISTQGVNGNNWVLAQLLYQR